VVPDVVPHSQFFITHLVLTVLGYLHSQYVTSPPVFTAAVDGDTGCMVYDLGSFSYSYFTSPPHYHFTSLNTSFSILCGDVSLVQPMALPHRELRDYDKSIHIHPVLIVESWLAAPGFCSVYLLSLAFWLVVASITHDTSVDYSWLFSLIRRWWACATQLQSIYISKHIHSLIFHPVLIALSWLTVSGFYSVYLLPLAFWLVVASITHDTSVDYSCLFSVIEQWWACAKQTKQLQLLHLLIRQQIDLADLGSFAHFTSFLHPKLMMVDNFC